MSAPVLLALGGVAYGAHRAKAVVPWETADLVLGKSASGLGAVAIFGGLVWISLSGFAQIELNRYRDSHSA